MTDLIHLTEAEIAAVGGGVISQTISIYATQRNSSSVSQSASASNSGRITATASGPYSTAVAVGAAASNVALVSQGNAIVAANTVSFRSYW